MRLLGGLSPAPTVRVVTIDALPGGEPMPVGGDLVDWIEAHGDAATPEVLVANLEELVAAAEPVDLTAGRPQPPAAYLPFPVEELPEPVRGFVIAGAKAIGCDPAFLALPMLTAVGAAIGTTRRVELKRGWSAPPILWTAVVGESGTSKTPAFRLVMAPVRELQRRYLEEHAAQEKAYLEDVAFHEKAHAEWKRDKKTTDAPPIKPEPPQATRLVVGDTTVEALAPILLANPRGVLLARDELAGWFGSFDRYSGGKGGSDSAHWLSMHIAETIVVDRKTGVSRTIVVPEAAVWVTGGIQPAVLHRALGAEHRDSGMAARLLLAHPPRIAKRWTEADIDPQAERDLAELVEHLYSLEYDIDDQGVDAPGVLPLTPDAKAIYKRFYNQHAREQAELTGDLAAAWSKLEEYAARLALVVHLIRWAAGDLPEDGSSDNTVDAASMAAGIALVAWFKREARRVYRQLSESDDDRRLRQLAEWIERKGGKVTAREVQQGRRDCPTAADAEAVLEELVAAGWGAWSVSAPTAKGGRPSRIFVLSTASTSTQPHNSRG
ncbi:hypothetical protein Pla123a_43140 [Posidoniimonas polymericola]|uniref:DUF3987 domain-containing protein n=1 Tax=Posidoniimonas polymericola TaxID=2528002 RepID=A0A5C5Y0I2_9BACT|nr:hypothetical protein Pla123a_43140 [Posidoniimonas polymericola]